MYGTSESEIRIGLSRILGDNKIQTIRFDSRLDTKKKRILANILARNHPLIEVLRLIPGNNVVNVGFSGIKKLNDIYGQNFVDRLLLATKSRILRSVDEYMYGKTGKKPPGNIRLVRDNYKNLTFSMFPDTDVQSVLFYGFISKKSFLDEVIRDMDTDIHSFAKERHIGPDTIKGDILKNWDF